MARILIVGGYGVFGSRAAERLARDRDLELIIAGRNEHAARTHAISLARSTGARVAHAVLDVGSVDASHIARHAPSVVINASGPFQAQDYRLAKACIAARCHYIDLADARAFVVGITTLQPAASAAGVAVISGASSVPGLSSVVVRHLARDFERMRRLDYAISPGNSFDPGLATTASILRYVGRPFTTRRGSQPVSVYGWQGLGRLDFPGLGRRWLGYADIPDLDLLPARHPDLESVRFRAGVEVGAFHLGMWALSWAVRAGLVNNADRLARPLLSIKHRLAALGSDRGGMVVIIEGTDRAGASLRRRWHLVAGSGHGPYVPAIASVILARRLAKGELRLTGAMPCMEQFSLADFAEATSDLDITTGIA